MLKNRTTIALLVAELISLTGTQMTFVALPWFVLVTTGSVAKMSLVLAVEIAPMALFGIPSGTVVARLGARRTMLISDAFRAPLMMLVPLLHWAGGLSFGVLLVVVFVLGVFTAPYFAAQRTIIPEIYGDDATVVGKVSAVFGGAQQLTLILGPALGGILVAAIGAPAVLVVDAATYLVAFVLVLAFVHGGKPVPADESSRGVLAGVRFLARDRVLGPMTLTLIILDAAASAIFTSLPALAYLRFDQDPKIVGWLFTAFGIGALCGSIVAMKALDRFTPLRLAAGAMVLVVLPLWALVADLPWEAVGVFLLLCGVFVPLVNAPIFGLLSTRPPEALRAKVMTAVMTSSALGGPAGRLVVGPMFQHWGISATYAALAGALSLGALLFVVAVLRADDDAPASAPVHDLAV
ncbi:MAG TPA: MFS transporter [Gaiellaceae bacterium]|jgi:predicted MFS family arabinose efflux permease|nr:MFS transporter [Gaiellaceae bacterium]